MSIEQEKVLKGLECCSAEIQNPDCDSCPYADSEQGGTCVSLQPLLKDALALLTPESPRVMATDEVKALKPGNSCWLEVWWEEDGKSGSTIEFCVVAPDWHLYSESSVTPLRELKAIWKANYKERYWNVKPTKEEREAASWEG